jgi:hypothetical protein
MGFWSELLKANPHQGVKRGDELGAASVVSIDPIYSPVEDNSTLHEANSSYRDPLTSREMRNGYLVCSVCRIAIGDVGNKNARPFTVTVDKTTPLTFADTNNVTVCSGCIEVFSVG